MLEISLIIMTMLPDERRPCGGGRRGRGGAGAAARAAAAVHATAAAVVPAARTELLQPARYTHTRKHHIIQMIYVRNSNYSKFKITLK